MSPPLGRLGLAVLLAVSLSGCAAARPRHIAGWCRGVPEAGPRLRTELLFGLSRPDGSLVAEDAWRAFLAEHVTPRFPDGLTVLEARGQYRDRSGRIVTEPSRVLVLVHGPDDGPRAAIADIRALYRKLFDQESVLVVTAPACVAF